MPNNAEEDSMNPFAQEVEDYNFDDGQSLGADSLEIIKSTTSMSGYHYAIRREEFPPGLIRNFDVVWLKMSPL